MAAHPGTPAPAECLLELAGPLCDLDKVIALLHARTPLLEAPLRGEASNTAAPRAECTHACASSTAQAHRPSLALPQLGADPLITSAIAIVQPPQEARTAQVDVATRRKTAILYSSTWWVLRIYVTAIAFVVSRGEGIGFRLDARRADAYIQNALARST